MEFFVIGERELVLGFRLAGVEGKSVSNRNEATEAFKNLTGQGSSVISLEERPTILVLTEDVSDMLQEEVQSWQMSGKIPLVVEIPGLQGRIKGRKSLTDSIREAVGIQV